jgi:bla regulator protein BlaR1
MRAVWIGTTVCIFAAGITSAQPATSPLTFEVASVRPSGPDARGFIGFLPGGGLRVVGISLKTLITLAYNVLDVQVNSDRFDINAQAEAARAPEDATADPAKLTEAQRMTMADLAKERLRNLLADRFQLTIHRETKEQQVYTLVVGKNGPKVKETKDGNGMMRMGRGMLHGEGVPLGFLATAMSGHLGRSVIDKTGLTGKYDIDLRWSPDPGQAGAGPFGELPQAPDPNGPSIFTAVQEQLGLRLESQKAPVETLVIDRVERPSEN